MSLSFLLVLEVFGLILTPCETAVYYVTPTTVPPNPACPQGQPCHTLDHYFSRKEEYFNSSKVNVTMLLMGGEHVLSGNHTEYMNMIGCLCTGYGHIIKDLEMFEMIGLEPARNVIILIFTKILLMNITISQIINLKFYLAAVPTN